MQKHLKNEIKNCNEKTKPKGVCHEKAKPVSNRKTITGFYLP